MRDAIQGLVGILVTGSVDQNAWVRWYSQLHSTSGTTEDRAVCTLAANQGLFQWGDVSAEGECIREALACLELDLDYEPYMAISDLYRQLWQKASVFTEKAMEWKAWVDPLGDVHQSRMQRALTGKQLASMQRVFKEWKWAGSRLSTIVQRWGLRSVGILLSVATLAVYAAWAYFGTMTATDVYGFSVFVWAYGLLPIASTVRGVFRNSDYSLAQAASTWGGQILGFGVIFRTLSLRQHAFLTSPLVHKDLMTFIVASLHTAFGQSMRGFNPASAQAATAMSVESLVGTAFLVIVIARLVSMWAPKEAFWKSDRQVSELLQDLDNASDAM